MLKYFGIDSSLLDERIKLKLKDKHFLRRFKHGAVLTGKYMLAPILFCVIVHELNHHNQSLK